MPPLQTSRSFDQLLVQPGGANGFGLPLDRQMTSHIDCRASQPIAVIRAALLREIFRNPPDRSGPAYSGGIGRSGEQMVMVPRAGIEPAT